MLVVSARVCEGAGRHYVCGGEEKGETGKSLATEGGLDFMDGKAWEAWET